MIEGLHMWILVWIMVHDLHHHSSVRALSFLYVVHVRMHNLLRNCLLILLRAISLLNYKLLVITTTLSNVHIKKILPQSINRCILIGLSLLESFGIVD